MKTSYEAFYIECGAGWARLYEALIDLCHLKGIEVTQVKEKFGGLRFYVGPCDEKTQMLIDAVEAYSYRVCEDCGEHGSKWIDGKVVYNVTTKGPGWIRSLCEPCRKMIEAKHESSTV